MHAHACYLINLAKEDEAKLEQGIEKLSRELSRCDLLGIPYLVLHPGSHLGNGEEEGIRRIQDALDRVHERVGDTDAMILLETMAGQGSVLPYTFEQLAEMRDGVAEPGRLGYCFDTCHVHAAGYDLSTESSYRDVMNRMEDQLRLEDVKLLHLNDSQHEAGARKDRHADIGEGTIGEEGFRCMMTDERWEDVPKILETPVDDDWKADYTRNMEVLLSYL